MPTAGAVIDRMVTQYGLGWVIPAADITSIAAGNITFGQLINDNVGTAHYVQQDVQIHRGTAASAADTRRPAGEFTPSTGVLDIAGANYADTTLGTESIRLIKHGLRVDYDFITAINRAQEYLGARDMLALSLASDAAMWQTSTAAYTAVNTTFTKTTTAADVFPGQRRGGLLTNSGADGHVYQRFLVTGGEEVYTGYFTRGKTGSPTLVWQDVTNTAAIGTTLTTSESSFQYLWRREFVPATCESLEVRFGASGASDVAPFGPVFVYRTNDARMVVPAEIEERYEFEALTYGVFHENTASQVEDAMSLETIEVPKDDYDFFFGAGQGQQSFIQFHNGTHRKWLRYPLFIQARLPDGDVTTVAAETDVTNLPLHTIVPKAMLEMLDAAGSRIPDAGRIRAMAEDNLRKALSIRVIEGPADKRPIQRQWRLAN